MRRSDQRLSLAVLISFVTTAHLFATPDLRGTVRVGGKPRQDAVIWLDVPGSAKATTDGPPVLDQRNLSFSPKVLAVRVGATVEFPNNDRVLHNVFSFRDGKPFDLGVYPIGTTQRVKFTKPGLSRLFCNIHPGMAAYVMVVDSDFFAVSNEDGSFTIAGLSPGAYTYHVWWPGGSVRTGSIVYESGTAVEVEWP